MTVQTSLGAPPPIQPRLYWISTTSQLSCKWPEKRSLGERPLEVFLEAFLLATDVAIIDPYFDGDCGMGSLWEVLKDFEGDRVRILTGLGESKRIEEWLRGRRYQMPRNVVVREGTTGVHDRFAIMDADLWHFGSTVGGGYNALSAVSHGWTAHSTDLRHVFETLWEG